MVRRSKYPLVHTVHTSPPWSNVPFQMVCIFLALESQRFPDPLYRGYDRDDQLGTSLQVYEVLQLLELRQARHVHEMVHMGPNHDVEHFPLLSSNDPS